jgi:hypothetical protein
VIEGEFHAVWSSPQGRLLDVTPKPDGETRILFLPDNKRVYRNEPVDNIRLALSDDPFIKALITKGEEMAKLRKKYNVGGTAAIPAEEFDRILANDANLNTPISAVGRNDPCPCGSGRKYKKCHGA